MLRFLWGFFLLSFALILSACCNDPLSALETGIQTSNNNILSFVFKALDNEKLAKNVTANINQEDKKIDLIVPRGTNVESLKPSVEHNGKDISPSSDIVQNFTNPIKYIVTAQDGKVNSYMVRVSYTNKNTNTVSSKAILSVMHKGSKVTNVGNKFTIILPVGADKTAPLTVTLKVSDGATLKEGKSSIMLTSNSVTKTIDFNTSDQRVFEVSGADGINKKEYTIIINVVSLTSKDAISFVFKPDNNNTVLTKEVIATVNINNKTIIATVPVGTDISNLIPSIKTNGKSISPATGIGQDFTTPVNYTVTAIDNSTQIYTVTVIATADTRSIQAEITSLVVDIAGKEIVGNINGTTITLNARIIPFGTNTKQGTIKTLTLSRGATANTVTNGVINFQNNETVVNVTAENGVIKQKYKVTIKFNKTQSSVTTYTKRNIFGQAIKDPVLKSDDVIIQANNVANVEFNWTWGSLKGTKTAVNGVLSLTKADLTNLAGLTNNTIKNFYFGVSGGAQSPRTNIVYKQFEIRTWQDLQAVRKNLNGNYILKTNIKFPDENGDGKGDYNFAPIRGSNSANNISHRFTGTFDGKGYTITRLYISRPNENRVGLFGYVGLGGTVKNVGLINAYIKGKNSVGGLAGESLGSMVAGFVKSTDTNNYGVFGEGNNVGGLVGTGSQYLVQSVGALYPSARYSNWVVGYVMGRVEGKNRVGGLVGQLNAVKNTTNPSGFNSGKFGTVIGYATGIVKGHTEVGGLIGYSESQTYGYAITSVSGVSQTGGVVGKNDGNRTYKADAYWDVTTTGQVSSAGGDKISSINNVIATRGEYFDTKGTTNTSDDFKIFQSRGILDKFTYFFEPPNKSKTWPKLKQSITISTPKAKETLSFPNQPTLP